MSLSNSQTGITDGFDMHLDGEADVITAIQRLPNFGLSLESIDGLKNWGLMVASEAQEVARDIDRPGEESSIVSGASNLQSAQTMPDIKSAISRVIVQWAGVMDAAGRKDDARTRLVDTFVGWASINPVDQRIFRDEVIDNLSISKNAVEAAVKKAAGAAADAGKGFWDKLMELLKGVGVWTGVGLGLVIVTYAAYKKYGTK